MRQFLGFCGYYRRFIQNFSQIAKPLSILMPIPKDKKKGKQIAKQKWVWGDEQQEAFHNLKALLSTPPILGFPNYAMPFELHTDASSLGLGAVLYQMQEGRRGSSVMQAEDSQSRRETTLHTRWSFWLSNGQ